jgi:hypothetical protein
MSEHAGRSNTQSTQAYWIKATVHYTLPKKKSYSNAMPYHAHAVLLLSLLFSDNFSFQQYNPTPHAIISHTMQVFPIRNA